MPLRHAWVLSGRHPSEPFNQEIDPRTEFSVFLERFSGTLISASVLDGPLPAVPSLFRRAGLPRMALASLVASRADEFDAIIASGEDIGIPIALASMPCFSRTPIHTMFHGHHLDSPKLRLLGPVLRRLPHLHFHCLSSSLRDLTQSVLGIPGSRCHATGYAADTNYFDNNFIVEQAVIASAGAANRDFATLAKAVRGLPVPVRIAAASTWMPPGAATGPVEWPDNAEARSYGSYARLRDLYRASLFVVIPLYSARYACGYAVIAEAMAMGRAVVVTRTDAPADFVIPGVTGVFVEPGDVAGLRKAITQLLESRAETAAMGQRARATMAGRHGLEQYCDRLAQIVSASITK